MFLNNCIEILINLFTSLNLGDFSKFLFIDHLLNYHIQQFLEENLKFPKRLEIFYNPFKEKCRHKLPKGVLNIVIEEARNLKNMDRYSLSSSDVSDPYAILAMSTSRYYRYQTPVVMDSLNPKWNYLCQIPIEKDNNVSSISITVMDKDVATSDDYLGSCVIFKEEIIPIITSNSSKEIKRKLDQKNQKKHGEIKIFISYSEVDFKKGSKDEFFEGILSVYVDSCFDLMQYENSHPYWKLKLAVGREVCSSNEIQMSSNPMFNEMFNFLVKNPKTDNLMINLINQKNERNGGFYKEQVKNILVKENYIDESYLKDLISNSPIGLKKDPKILLSFEFSYLKHSEETLIKLRQNIPIQRLPSIIDKGLSNMKSKFKERRHSSKSVPLLYLSVTYVIKESLLMIYLRKLEKLNLLNSFTIDPKVQTQNKIIFMKFHLPFFSIVIIKADCYHLIKTLKNLIPFDVKKNYIR